MLDVGFFSRQCRCTFGSISPVSGFIHSPPHSTTAVAVPSRASSVERAARWALVTLHGKADAFAEIVGLAFLWFLKGRDRRAEDGGLMPGGRLGGADDSDVQEVFVANPDCLDVYGLPLLLPLSGNSRSEINPSGSRSRIRC